MIFIENQVWCTHRTCIHLLKIRGFAEIIKFRHRKCMLKRYFNQKCRNFLCSLKSWNICVIFDYLSSWAYVYDGEKIKKSMVWIKLLCKYAKHMRLDMEAWILQVEFFSISDWDISELHWFILIKNTCETELTNKLGICNWNKKNIHKQ